MGLRVQSYSILFAPPYSFSVHFTSPFSPFAVLGAKKDRKKTINADWGIRQKENVDHYLIVYVLEVSPNT